MLRVLAISLLILTLVGSSLTGEPSFAGIVELRTPTAFTTNQETTETNIETQVFEVVIQDYPIDSIAFSRSILTDKLLMIRLSYNKNPDSLLEEQWQMIRRLLKKHGTPTRVMEDTLQWDASDLIINAEVSERIVSYYYIQHISEHCELGNQTATHSIL